MLYLSICIPTFKRVDVVRKSIEAIYADTKGISLDEFEVIVSDNDPEESSRCFENEFKYQNFRYISTKCNGFLNSFYVLTYGKGVMLKLHNNRDQLRPGMLKYMLNLIKYYLAEKPVIVYTKGKLGYKQPYIAYTADDFLYKLSYFASWSSGFNIWKSDFDHIKNSIICDKMFPQTSLLFACLDKNKFIIDDINMSKGPGLKIDTLSYNPIYVFGVEFLDLVNEIYEKGIISKRTFDKIRHETMSKYLAVQYFKTKVLRKNHIRYVDIAKNLSKYYGKLGFYKLLYHVAITPLYYILKK